MERAAEPERQAADGFFVRRIDGEETALWAQAQALYAAQGADGVWTHQGDYRIAFCGSGADVAADPREALKAPQTAPVASPLPTL